LPDAEVREARDRVRAALNHAHFEFPARRITVNLAPAELPKDSSRFDLPIALAILAASGQLPLDALAGQEFAGELSLTGGCGRCAGRSPWRCRPARRLRVRVAGGNCAAGGACAGSASCRRERLEVVAHLAGEARLVEYSRQRAALAYPISATSRGRIR
jgi:magnesium chelatase family protein